MRSIRVLVSVARVADRLFQFEPVGDVPDAGRLVHDIQKAAPAGVFEMPLAPYALYTVVGKWANEKLTPARMSGGLMSVAIGGTVRMMRKK